MVESPGVMRLDPGSVASSLKCVVLGRANQIVSDVGSNANLDRIGREAGLDMFINTNPAQGRTISPVTMTATVEAVLGAVYLDGDMDAVKRVMEKLGLRAV